MGPVNCGIRRRLLNLNYDFRMCNEHGAVTQTQGTDARTVNCGRVYSTCILKPVLSGRNL